MTSNTLNHRTESAEYWRRRADELRRVAVLLSPNARSTVLELAGECERRDKALRARLPERGRG